MSNVRLELVWPNKDKFLLSPQDEAGKPVWVERSHPAAREVRLTEFTDAVGQVDDQNPERDNLLFVGDSLDALRILNETPAFRREYRGKVKLIYIDPPFNTGQTFEHYDDWMEHSTWLSFMRDRLFLMKDLLSPDGSIWVHLDDAEVHRMRALMDEVFGANNFVATVVWERTDSAAMQAKISYNHDNILVFQKSPAFLPNGFDDYESNTAFSKVDEDGRKYYTHTLRMSGPGSQREDRPTMWYPMVAPDGTEVFPIRQNGTEGRWRWGPEKYEREKATIVWRQTKEGGWEPSRRIYQDASQPKPSLTIWPYSEVGSNRHGKLEVSALFPGQTPFSTPKPEKLLQKVIHIATDVGDVVLDLFGGSGTTAATAHKMGRRWITAEIQTSTAKSFIQPRLSRVVEGSDPGGVTTQVGWESGGGFRTVEIQDSFYALTPLGVMLTDDAEGQPFARSVAGQLGFDWAPTAGYLCAKRGRMRLAVLDGAVGVEEAREIVAELEESERVTIVARVILEGAEEWLSDNSRGSICLKAPNDVLRERRKRRRSMGGEA
jgi:adenine-specific DNA-methyltransferase